MRIRGIESHVLTWHAGEKHRGALLGQQREDPRDRLRDAVLPVGDQYQVDEGPEDPANSIGNPEAK